MRKTTFMFYRVALIIAGCFAVSWAILSENYIVLPIILVGWASLLFFFMSKVKGVLKDERSERIHEKTSRIAIPVFVVIACIAGAILTIWGINTNSSLIQTGFTVANTAAGLLIIYWIIYIYYAKKY